MRERALSLWQPWAWLVVHGHKPLENRPWRTDYRGPLLIHASKKVDPDIDRICRAVSERFGIVIPDRLETGGIVGRVRVTGCIDGSLSPWFRGPFALALADAEPLPYRPCLGKQRFFYVDYESPPTASGLETQKGAGA
ncbi:MAG: ASCH domain-containing protein [Bacillota bacterium]|jgi:hypothetical protein|nr:MAG: ASCH domain-containing protein [Bacillota bacterium]